ncbi:recombinase family protein [Hymenobacter amundsenii]|uniref:recombinase family protein n=1 Tax=Hymenobacter amundsenii TaxID=2006685 RepID=UPI0013FDF864
MESSKRNHRPQLAAAMAEARRVGATLPIAKLDRLSRNAGFIFALRDSGVDFICCEMPEANTLTVGLFAVIAQHERELISKRTKEALAVLKARGVALGMPANLTTKSIQQGQVVRQQNARENKENRQATRLAVLLRQQGHTLQQIAQELTSGDYRTRRGKNFDATAVCRLLNRHADSTETA